MKSACGSWIDRVREIVSRRGEAPPAGRSTRPRRIGPSELEQAVRGARPPVVVDIRGPEAFAAGHLPGAVNIPLGELRRAVGRLDRAAPTVVY